MLNRINYPESILNHIVFIIQVIHEHIGIVIHILT